MNDWDIQVGEKLKRTELHDRYGGNRQRGISPSRKSPNIFLFSAPEAAEKHGYADDLGGDPILYYGEGQYGAQELTHGNLAVLRHEDSNRTLRLFRVAGSEVEYLGEAELDDDPYFWTRGVQTGGGDQRDLIVFRLRLRSS